MPSSDRVKPGRICSKYNAEMQVISDVLLNKKINVKVKVFVKGIKRNNIFTFNL